MPANLSSIIEDLEDEEEAQEVRRLGDIVDYWNTPEMLEKYPCECEKPMCGTCSVRFLLGKVETLTTEAVFLREDKMNMTVNSDRAIKRYTEKIESLTSERDVALRQLRVANQRVYDEHNYPGCTPCGCFTCSEVRKRT